MQASTRDWQQAQDLFQSALATDPNNALAHHWQSMFLGAVGDYQGALTHAQRAVALEPATPVFRDRLGIAHMWLNDLQAAEREFVRAEQLGFALDFRSKAFVLWLVRSGRFDELRRLLLHRRLPPDWVATFVDALENPELHAAAVQASDAAIDAHTIPRELQFGVWVALQEPERAVAAFDLSYKTDDEEFLWAPECEFLAQAPGYEALLADLGLDEASRIELAKQRDKLP